MTLYLLLSSLGYERLNIQCLSWSSEVGFWNFNKFPRHFFHRSKQQMYCNKPQASLSSKVRRKKDLEVTWLYYILSNIIVNFYLSFYRRGFDSDISCIVSPKIIKHCYKEKIHQYTLLYDHQLYLDVQVNLCFKFLSAQILFQNFNFNLEHLAFRVTIQVLEL